MFTMWVILGYVSNGMNVDPTSAESIEEYKEWKEKTGNSHY